MEMLERMPERHPLNGTFELTVRCNLNCKMCLFKHCESENAELKKNELSADEWIDLAKQACDMGTGGILFTGGEPLLRPDFPKIYESIYKMGFMISVYTNATLVNDKIMELFSKYPPHKIGVTIYGASSETYEKVCDNASAFQKAIDGIHRLMTLPSVIDFRTTIIKDNFHEARDIDKLVSEQFGKQYIVTQTRMVMKSVRGACTKVEECRLSPENNVKLSLMRSFDKIKEIIGDEFDENNIRFRRNGSDKNSDCQEKDTGYISLLGCNGGMTSFAITWDGKLQACQILGAFQTDARKDGLKQAWENFPFTVKIPPINEKCASCTMVDLCQCCFASRYAETGSLTGCPEYVCEDARVMNTYISKEVD